RSTAGSCSPPWTSAATPCSGSTRAAPAERHCPAGPVVHAAVQNRSRVDTGCCEHACRDTGTHPGLADRHDRLLHIDAVGTEIAQEPERDVQRARDVPLVALRLLPDVEHLHFAFLEQ